MKLLPNISKTIIHSFLFAIGGAPTIAMIISSLQTNDQELLFQAFVGLTIIFACVLIPLIFIQNLFLLIKRQSVVVEDKIKPLSQFYLLLNVGSLIYWLLRVFNQI
ncbi:hypothetical protein EC844_10937 [Acinetobacter calcoaceticus]|uniref:DUF1705 domain-containing protein n=1 Tax=Acinetobacter calcoaceticus TaxID=471 RepID=A0A4V2R151_ACICA|nr:hypothetical protein EC844_10937 [Acinetobacter calcoaceticus]